MPFIYQELSNTKSQIMKENKSGELLQIVVSLLFQENQAKIWLLFHFQSARSYNVYFTTLV